MKKLFINFSVKIVKGLKSVIDGLFSGDRKAKLQKVIQIVQNIKHAVDGKLAAELVKIIPGDRDDMLRTSLSIILTEVLYRLNLVHKGSIGNEALKHAVDVIHSFPRKERKAYYDSIAGQLTSEVIKVPYETARTVANEFYMNEFVDETVTV